jgi:hypothetical protein
MRATPARFRPLERLLRTALGLALGFSVLLTLVVAVWLIFHAHPSGDDFCNGVNARKWGVVQAVWQQYMNWGGRWGALTLAVGFSALFELTRWYPLPLLGMLALFVVATRALIGAVLPLGDDRPLAWLLTTLFVTLYWSGMAHPGQTVYWLEGGYIYSLNISLCMLLLAWLLRFPKEPSPRRAAATGALAVCCLVVASFHELFGLILGGVLLTGAVLALLQGDSRGRAWVLACAGAFAGAATVALSPGSAVRGLVSNPEGPSVTRTITVTIQMWVRILDAPVTRGEGVGSLRPLGWMVDARLLAATALFATSARVRALRPAWLERDCALYQILVPLLLVAALTASFVAGGWALGRTLPLRAFNGLYVFFLLAWFLGVFVYTRPAFSPEAPGSGIALLRFFSTAVLALALLGSPNLKYALRDLGKGTLSRYDRTMVQRYAEAARLREAGGGELVVRPIEPWPSSYFRNDVGEISPPLQECVAAYLGVDSIRLVAEPAGARD